jgi:hypothetical protein
MGQLDSGVHRVLGAVTSSTNPAGLIIRDYQKRDRPDGGATISPLQEWRSVCDGKIIAIPMLSKTGLYLSGTFNGTTRVFRIGPNASECVEVFDSGVVSGKADFSVDDRYIVYVSRAEQPNKRVQVDAVFLADLQDRSVQPIFYAGPDTQLAFPAFMTADRVVVFDQTASQLIVLDRTRRILE